MAIFDRALSVDACRSCRCNRNTACFAAAAAVVDAKTALGRRLVSEASTRQGPRRGFILVLGKVVVRRQRPACAELGQSRRPPHQLRGRGAAMSNGGLLQGRRGCQRAVRQGKWSRDATLETENGRDPGIGDRPIQARGVARQDAEATAPPCPVSLSFSESSNINTEQEAYMYLSSLEIISIEWQYVRFNVEEQWI
jgi:hypothetical protein